MPPMDGLEQQKSMLSQFGARCLKSWSQQDHAFPEDSSGGVLPCFLAGILWLLLLVDATLQLLPLSSRGILPVHLSKFPSS